MAKEKNTKNTAEPKFPLIYLVPLIAVLAIIPLIVHMYKYDTGLTKYASFQGPSTTYDFFLHSKMTWLLFILALCIFILAYMIFAAEIPAVWNKQLLPLVIYCALTFISALASTDIGYSFSGIYEQFESVWILMGYGILVYYAFYVISSEAALKRLMPWFVGGIVVMGVIGILQALSHDLYSYRWFQKLFIVPSNATQNFKFKFNFELGRVYLSLYNPNYVGFYVALVVPVLLALLLHTKKILFKIGYGLLALVMLFCLFASQSRAGIIALIISCFIMLLCMRRVFLKNWLVTTITIGLVAVVFIGVNVMNHGILIDRMKSMFSTSAETHPLESILTGEDVTVTYNKQTLHITTTTDEDENTTFTLKDSSNKNVAYSEKEDSIVITDTRFPFTLTAINEQKFKGFGVKIDDKTWYFSNRLKQGDSRYYAKGAGSSLVLLTNHEKSLKFLEEHYHFANMRGYIWARTLPLLKKYFFLGSGPDTFTIAFPNDDFVGLYNSGHDQEIISRPHCMYLQIAVQTGVPSLIAFLIFFGWYIISSLRLYWKQSYESYMSKIGVGILASVIGYLILALTNDSCIAVSPIFWVLTGIGLAINRQLKKANEQAA